MKTTATPCTHAHCRRTTKDSSGRCHDHRVAAPSRPESAHALSPPSVTSKPRRIERSLIDGSKGWVIQYRDAAQRISRLDGPALITYGTDGRVETEEWFVEGLRERADGLPTRVDYHDDGSVGIEWWKPHGNLHRTDGPARICYRQDGSIEREDYSLNGSVHRVGAPAVIRYGMDGGADTEEWFREGDRHRIDGPAVVIRTPDGEVASTQWRVDGTEFDGPEGVAAYLVSAETFDYGLEVDEWIRESSYGALIEENGISYRDVVTMLGQGVTTVAGMREVLGGAPAEWVRAYEQGRGLDTP